MTRARKTLGTLLAVLAGLAAPLTVVVGWTHTLLTDSATFAATYAPLMQSASMQEVLSDRISKAISNRLGIDSRSTRDLVSRAVGEVASSELFAQAATIGLRSTAKELSEVLSKDPGESRGQAAKVSLPLAPFAEAAKRHLSANEVPFADRIPKVSGSIPLFRIEPQAIGQARMAYLAVDALAAWLPWVMVGSAIASVLISSRRRSGLIALGLSMTGGVVVLGGGWTLLIYALVEHLGPNLAPLAGTAAEMTVTPVALPLLVIAGGGAALALVALLATSRGRQAAPSGG